MSATPTSAPEPSPLQNYDLLPLTGVKDADIERNFRFIAASTKQIIFWIAYLNGLVRRIPGIEKMVMFVRNQVAGMATTLAAMQVEIDDINIELAYLTAPSLKLTAGGAPTTWALSAQAGYPNIGLVIVDTNGQIGNILTLPASPIDEYEIWVKILDATGDLTLDGNGKDILTYSSSGSYLLPRIGADTTIYGVRLKYLAGDDVWHIIASAVGA